MYLGFWTPWTSVQSRLTLSQAVCKRPCFYVSAVANHSLKLSALNRAQRPWPEAG